MGGDALVPMVTALCVEHCGSASRGLEMTTAPAVGTQELPCPAYFLLCKTVSASVFHPWLHLNNQLQFILYQLMREIVQLMREAFLVSKSVMQVTNHVLH